MKTTTGRVLCVSLALVSALLLSGCAVKGGVGGAAGDAGALAACLARVMARPAPERERAAGAPAGLSWDAAAARTELVYREAGPPAR